MPHAEIVIRSSWRDAFPLRDMRKLFSPDVAARVRGVIPPESPNVDHPRYEAIKTYLCTAGLNGPWIAIDDDARQYPLGCGNLLLADGSVGFDVQASSKLISRALAVRQ